MSENEQVQEVESRVLVGLQAGRIVNYVMKNLAIRPLLIVEPFDGTGIVNGILFFDGANDNGNHPEPLAIDASGHEPLCCTPVASVKYMPTPGPSVEDPAAVIESLVPGTWHWPKMAPVRASSVDANVLETLVEQLGAKLRDELLGNQDQMIQTLNAKLQATVDSVNAQLDSHSQLVQRVANFNGIVIGSGGDAQPNGAPAGAPAEAPGLPSDADLDAHVAEQAIAGQTTTPSEPSPEPQAEEPVEPAQLTGDAKAAESGS